MELQSLDQNFQPLNLIENYSSLIWTERYSKFGDFTLVSNNISEMVNLLPLESYVTLRESTVPMVVETHTIKKPTRDIPQIEIKGRSFETVLDRRASVNSLPGSYTSRAVWNIEANKESDAAYLATRIVIGDSARVQGSVTVLPLTNPAVSSLDAIPQIDLTLPADYVDVLNILVWSSTTSYATGDKVKYQGFVWQALRFHSNITPGTVTTPPTWQQLQAYATYEIKSQNLYNTVMDLINVNHRGIKSVRPSSTGTKVGVEIYNGADLTNTYTLDVKFDQIDDGTYLLSKMGSTNVAYVYGSNGSQQVNKTTTIPSGLDRRVLLLDVTSDSTTSSTTVRKTRGLIELYKYNATALFDGQVADQVAAGYNKDYFLGDILKLVGEYGLSQNARVVEFIRTKDATGEKAYPAFEAVTD